MRAICGKCVNECTVEMKIGAELPENCLYKHGSVVPKWEPLSDMGKVKEPELMTLVEAARLCTKKGDEIHSANGEYGILFEDFASHGGLTTSELLRVDEWYFTPAEPKVLGADEFVKGIGSTIFVNHSEQTIDWYWRFVKTFEKGDQNGQLKMYNKLDNEIKKFLHWWSGEGSRTGNRLEEIVKNIKPLNQ